MSGLLSLRAIFVFLLAITGFWLHPFGLGRWYGAMVGAAVGAALMFFEMQVRRISLKRLIGATAGSIVGILAAYLMSLVLGHAGAGSANVVPFVEIALLAATTYLGLVVGASKGDSLNLSALGGLFGSERAGAASLKLLDTSVIIDGRIADIVESGFLDGTLAIPQFVLRELQMVADSSDSMKRNRGRRGLDVLQRIQKLPGLKVEILEDDFPQVREVDLKLIELAKLRECKIVTNDFNLNKVAQLRGVEVLNINELANALKPVVLPGETMRVFILKEGKEYSQGVAYLDDGTMVVVDNARKMISRTIDITVTSVLQTTAGKMIFGRFDERLHAVYDKQQQADRAERAAREGPAGAQAG